MYNSNINVTNNNISALSCMTKRINNSINNVRKKIQSMEKNMFTELRSIANKIFRVYGRIAQLLVVVYGIVYRIARLFRTILNAIRHAYFTMGSVWNGPIGGTARYFGRYMGMPI